MEKYIYLDCFWGDYASVAREVGNRLRWGLIDRLGCEIIPTIYDQIQYVGSDVVFVNVGYKEGRKCEYSGKWGIVNLKNEIVVPMSFTHLYPWNNRATVCRRNRWGVIDYSGNMIIPIEYDSLFLVENDELYVFEKKGKFGLIDAQGSILVAPIYDQINHCNRFDSRNWFAARRGEQWLYIDKSGKSVIDKFDDVSI